MSLNLLNIVKDQLSDGAMNKIASLIGENSSTTSKAVSSFLPTLLSGIVDKSSSVSGSVNLLKLISDNNLGANTLNNLTANFDAGNKSNAWMKTGSKLVSGIFGNKQDSVLSKLGSLAGIKSSASTSLMSMLAPLVMGSIGKIVKSDNLDASGLQRLLSSQKSSIYGALPAGISETLGFADHNSSTRNTTKTTTASTTTHHREDNNSGGGWWKWLLLLPLLGLLYWFLSRDKVVDTKTTTEIKTETTAVTGHEGHNHGANDGHDHGSHDGHNHGTTATTTKYSYHIDANGNLVDSKGNIIVKAGQYKKDTHGNLIDARGTILAKAGEFGGSLKSMTTKITDNVPNVNVQDIKFTKDVNGNLIDKSGKIVYKAGDFTEKDGYYVDKQGNKIGFFGKIGKAIEDAAGAVGGAAEATAEAFAGVFTGLFSKKEKQGTTHSLTKIVFDKENHRIKYFSKAEFEAMVAALKMYPESKIQVQVHTNDGANEKENNKLTDKRAEQLHDMMVTLGINDKQISHKGMGSSNAAKAAADKVDIFIEK